MLTSLTWFWVPHYRAAQRGDRVPCKYILSVVAKDAKGEILRLGELHDPNITSYTRVRYIVKDKKN